MNLKWIAAVIGATGLCHAETVPLFNGKDLQGWKVVAFDGGGAVSVRPDGAVSCAAGKPMSGIAYTNPVPTMSYELKLEAMRVEGSDFFIGLTIPIEDRFCTVIIGGWGGGLCGVSCVDYMSAAENMWSESVTFEDNRWYALRVRVMPNVLQVFLNDDLYRARIEYENPSRFSLLSGSDIDMTRPLGIATYQTSALWRNLTLTKITKPAPDDKPRGQDGE